MPDFRLAARRLDEVVSKGRSLQTDDLVGVDREIVSGSLRRYFELDFLVEALIDKPLPAKHSDLHALLIVGLYSVRYLSRPVHASVNECVSATAALRKRWARGLVNAVLRNYQRKQQTLEAALAGDREASTNHPAWLLDSLAEAWPSQHDDIVSANNSRAPMTLRINLRATDRDSYQQRLAEAGIEAHTGKLDTPSALVLASAVPVTRLPGFEDGLVSVQDEASQLAAILLDVKKGQTVLDACAAPGGKTCHLLETYDDIKLVANDSDESRLTRVEENTRRLGLQCELRAKPAEALSGEVFDRILLDAPCSATGIVRRHPDIKLLRQAEDIAKLATTQLAILHALWHCLAPGGKLLYSTCSVLPEENDAVVASFIDTCSDAVVQPLTLPTGEQTRHGWQLFPGEHDGFYYTLLTRRDTNA